MYMCEIHIRVLTRDKNVQIFQKTIITMKTFDFLLWLIYIFNFLETTCEELRSSSSSRIGGADRQISHLATLLSESESQNSRLEKLVEVLKEEIRTYQRSEERHKHIENLEYVKNVIMKFITLSGAQERARLIPVLKTILRLKNEEVEQIEELVKGNYILLCVHILFY